MKPSIPVSLILSVAAAFPADLPVKQVVLYKHGVGFFERSGKLAAGESARLDFNATEMNDVLKSLTIGASGGKNHRLALRFRRIPLSHKLEEFPFQIGGGGMPGMLDQLKGARVELKLGTESVVGIIVSARTSAGTDKQVERDQLNLMLDNGEFRTVDLAAASGLRFSDPKLQQQFKDYLAVVAAARSKDKRSVYIDSTDARERDITASYMIPAPVWKSSYRLIFGDKAPMLEGWAIVDNMTGEDWTKVQLSLVSGRPISFISQLYAPKYVTRPSAGAARRFPRRRRWSIRVHSRSRGPSPSSRGGAGREVPSMNARAPLRCLQRRRRWPRCPPARWIGNLVSRPVPLRPPPSAANSATSSSTASRSRSLSARTNPRCSPSCNRTSTGANC